MTKKEKRLSISIKDIHSLICLSVIFAPLGLFVVRGFTEIITVARCLIIIYYLLRHIKQKQSLCKPSIICLLLIALISVVTLANGLDIEAYLKNALGIAAFIFYSNIEFRNNYAKNLTYLEKLFSVILSINLIMVITGINLGNNDSYPNYLLGMRTRFSDMVYPYICILIINNLTIKKNLKRVIFGTVLALATVIIPAISTAIGSLAIFLLLYLLLRKIGGKSYRAMILITLLLSLSILFFRVQDVFSPIIENLLHKNITFTGRTYIWDSAIAYISQKPILGHGYNATGIAHYWGHLYQPHNQLLDLLANGGILAALLFSLFIIKAVKYSKTPSFKPAIAMLCAVLFACTFERYAQYPLFYILPFIIYFAGAKNEKENEYKH